MNVTQTMRCVEDAAPYRWREIKNRSLSVARASPVVGDGVLDVPPRCSRAMRGAQFTAASPSNSFVPLTLRSRSLPYGGGVTTCRDGRGTQDKPRINGKATHYLPLPALRTTSPVGEATGNAGAGVFLNVIKTMRCVEDAAPYRRREIKNRSLSVARASPVVGDGVDVPLQSVARASPVREANLFFLAFLQEKNFGKRRLGTGGGRRFCKAGRAVSAFFRRAKPPSF